jgi:hypothetical protein
MSTKLFGKSVEIFQFFNFDISLCAQTFCKLVVECGTMNGTTGIGFVSVYNVLLVYMLGMVVLVDKNGDLLQQTD